MVKKVNDKKVVKAIALGLATMITAGTMSSLPVRAEGIPTNDDNASKLKEQMDCTDPKKLDQNLTIGGRYFYG